MASTATTSTGDAGDTAVIQCRGSKLIDVSVSGIVSGDVVTAERSPDGGTTWFNIETYTVDTQRVLQSASFKDHRLKYLTDGGGGTILMTIRAGNGY